MLNNIRTASSKEIPQNRGFTLIELLVALGIFSIVMTISLGAVLTVMNANRKSQVERKTIDTVGFVLEEMVRNMRQGKNFYCTGDENAAVTSGDLPVGDCSSGLLIAFDHTDGHRIVYRLHQNGGSPRIQKSVSGGAYVDLTSDDVAIDQFKFYTIGSQFDDATHSRILIVFKGSAKIGERASSKVSLQTTVAQRYTDL